MSLLGYRPRPDGKIALVDSTAPPPTFDQSSHLSSTDIIAGLRRVVIDGTPWWIAVLQAIARWQLPEEAVNGRYYRYLIGGEAFDWLLLAERLTTEIADLIPVAEHEALFFSGRLPVTLDEMEFKRLIGPSKYRAHLNYLYGVTAEEALQLAVEEELHKEERCRIGSGTSRADEAVFERIYGKSQLQLLAEFYESRGLPQPDVIPFQELKEFTYWLFKYRLRSCDPARVASDTRKALAQLSKLENIWLRSSRTPPEPEFVIDGNLR